MEYPEFRATGAERERDWQSSVLAKRPRNDYDYNYTRDTSLSGVYVSPREDLRVADRGGDRVGVRLLDDHVHAPSLRFLDDHRFVSQTERLTYSNRLREDKGFNFRSDSNRLDPLIGRRQPVDDLPYLPADASNTLFVMGVPSDCTSREAAHIFRPFRGLKEVRIVKKPRESKKSRGDGEGESASAVFVLSFVEFDNPKCAATAMEALQEYKFDENDRDSSSLKLQFDRERRMSSFAHDEDRDRDYYRYHR